MSTTLRRLKITENSLVDAGANPHAKVLLAKRAPLAKVGSDSSYEAKREAISGALRLILGDPYGPGGSGWYTEATFEDRAVICVGGAKWAYPVSFDATGRAALGDRYEVEVDYRPVNSQEAEMDVAKLAPEVKAHVTKLAADAQAAEERAVKAETELAELKKAKPPEPEDVLKGLTPEAKAVVEKAQATAADATQRIAKLEDENQTRVYLAKAEAMPQLTKAPKEMGALLKAAAQKLEKPEFEALETLLKAANEQIAKGKLFSQAGADGPGDPAENAFATAKVRAQELVTKGEAKTIEQGVVEVFKRDPALYRQHRAEQRKGN